jgi:hypothetical protein
VGTTSRPPKWIKPPLTRLVAEAPTGNGRLHEIKYDGYSPFRWLDKGVGMLAVRRVARKVFARPEAQGETDDC